MTTIAYDGKTLATDTLVSSAGLAFGQGKKLHRLKDGRYMAITGTLSLGPALIKFFEGGKKPELHEDDCIGGLVVDKKGNAFEFDNSMRLFPACVPWAGGTGESIALTAMLCGKDAVEAVRIACRLDLKSREPIDSVRICK